MPTLARPRAWLGSALAGATVLGAAAIAVAPTLEAQFMGLSYGRLALDPWGIPVDFHQPERMRLLTPALAWALGVPGWAWPWVPLVAGALFLAVVHRFVRDEGLSRADALGVTTLVGTASPLTWTLEFPGYVDTTSWLFLALAVTRLWRRSHAWAPFFAIGLLNHEALAFLAPALVGVAVLRADTGRKLRAACVAGGLALTALLAFGLSRIALAELLPFPPQLGPSEAAPGSAFTSGLPTLLLGLFMAWKAAWVVPFLVAAAERESGGLRLTWVLFSFVAFAAAQLPFATDTTRLLAPAFVAVVLGLIELHRRLPRPRFALLLWGLVAVNAAVPQAFAVPQGLAVSQPLPIALVLASQGRWDFRRASIYAPPEYGRGRP